MHEKILNKINGGVNKIWVHWEEYSKERKHEQKINNLREGDKGGNI